MLDVGAGSGIDRPDWMHAAVASVATETVGVELDAKLAARARERGFDVVAADAQTLDLGRTFDVVWAGELIEHLSCAGGFLDAARRHLEPGGRLVLTTPNAFAVSNFVYRIGGRPAGQQGSHVLVRRDHALAAAAPARIRRRRSVVPAASNARAGAGVGRRRGAIGVAPSSRGEHAARRRDEGLSRTAPSVLPVRRA